LFEKLKEIISTTNQIKIILLYKMEWLFEKDSYDNISSEVESRRNIQIYMIVSCTLLVLLIVLLFVFWLWSCCFRTTNHLETNFDSVEPSKEKQILEKV